MDQERREIDIQDAFLGRARKERTAVAVLLVSGKKGTGRIRGRSPGRNPEPDGIPC